MHCVLSWLRIWFCCEPGVRLFTYVKCITLKVLWAPLAKETQVCHVEKLTVRRKVAQPLVLSTLAWQRENNIRKFPAVCFPSLRTNILLFPEENRNNSGIILAFYFLWYQYNVTILPSQKQTQFIMMNIIWNISKSNGNYMNCQEFDGSLNDEASLVWFVNKILIILQSDAD